MEYLVFTTRFGLQLSAAFCIAGTCMAGIGDSPTNPAISAKHLQSVNPLTPDGIYWIDPDGGDPSNSFQAFCDMTTSGGGWTLALSSASMSPSATTDIVANTGLVPLPGMGHTRNLAALAIDQDAEIRHVLLDSSPDNFFHAKYEGRYHDTLPLFADWIPLVGHTLGSDSMLAAHFGRAWSTATNDVDLSAGNCAADHGVPWYYGSCFSAIPTVAAGPLTPAPYGGGSSASAVLQRYTIYVRESVDYVFVPTSVVQQPIDQTLPEGDSFELSVIMAGSLSASFQWRKGDVELMGETGDTLVIDPAAHAHSGSYHVVITDACGLVLTSDNALVDVILGEDFCNGDGGDQMGCLNCPCTNNSAPGTIGGCLNSVGTSARIFAFGDTSVSLPPGVATDLRISLTGSPGSSFCVLLSGAAVAPQNMNNACFGMNTGVGSLFFDGLRCAVQNVRRHGGRSSDPSGNVGFTNNPWGGEAGPIPGIAHAGGSFVAGQVRYFQVIHRESSALSCMRGLNTSQALGLTFLP